MSGADAPTTPTASSTSTTPTAPTTSTTTTVSPPPPIGPAFDTTAWDRVRRWRPSPMGLALAALLVLALAVLMLTTTRRTGYLDPGAVDPSGSRAVANILGDMGVRVADVRTTEAAAGAVEAAAGVGGAAVLITDPNLLTPEMLGQIVDAGPARLILVEPLPGAPALDRLAAGTGLAAGADLPADAEIGDGQVGEGDEPVDPRCRLPEAIRAGDAELPGLRYDAQAWAEAGEACYDRPASAALLVIPARAGLPEVVVLGSAHPLTNDGLDARGNAALVLGLLGSRADLVWWRPDPGDPALAGHSVALIELVPGWVVPVLAQVLLALLLVAWWRGRRLGRIVVESLPVVVRAGETTAGHGRLLHANGARAEAALHLRARARERTRSRLGLSPKVAEGRLVAAVAIRCSRAPEQVAALLYGPEPTTDEQLVALGHDLESLMMEVGGA